MLQIKRIDLGVGKMSSLSDITRKFPGLLDLMRKLLPTEFKRRLAFYLLGQIKKGQTTESADGRKFFVIPDRVFLSVLYSGDYEKQISKFVRSYLTTKDICVDVGANFGWYSTLFGCIASKVWAFEPGERISSVLVKNLELNDLSEKVIVRDVAVGAHRGVAYHLIEGSDNTESALGYISNSETIGSEATKTQIVTLSDELENEIDNIALIKIDVEGFEHHALLGAKSILGSKNPPVIICEANHEALKRADSTREELSKLLKESGYNLFDIRSKGVFKEDNGTASDLLCIPDRGQFKKRMENLF